MSDDQSNPYAPTALTAEMTGEFSRRPLTRRMRFTFFAHGVALPVILLGMSLAGTHVTSEAPWQSGQLKDYVAMLLVPVAWFPFAPAIVYCLISLGAWTLWPKMSDRAWVRLGIYTGVPLSLHFLVLLLLIYDGPMIILIAMVWPCWHVGLWVLNYFWRRQISLWHVMAIMTMCAVLLAVFRQHALAAVNLPLAAGMFLLVAAPGLNVVAYCQAAWSVYGSQSSVARRTRFGMLGVFVLWIVAWLLGWRWAILVMLDEYSKLPTTNPNCYMSNAAAYAHPLLTGAARPGEVTACMRRLKFLEIVMRATAPTLHQMIRCEYDRWCPPLAAVCQHNVILASLTRLGLVPLELLAELLRVGLRIGRKQVDRIYENALTSPAFAPIESRC